MNAPDQATEPGQAVQAVVPRAIEVAFPVVEINRLAEPERNSFKPIYQMHKWFARRASCVFRAILLGALKPAVQPDGTPTDLMAEFYKNHADDPDTSGKVVLDPFMGGGTTVVEALRLGCKVIGIDLNPVAWFVVKTEIEPVDLAALNDAFERLAARPVGWNSGKPLRETLLDLYKTEIGPGIEADVIYTFWVKHAICTDQSCRKETPLFKDWIVAHRAMTVRYWRDVTCPACRTPFDWETQTASDNAYRTLNGQVKLERLEDGSSAVAEPSFAYDAGSRAVLRCESSSGVGEVVKCDAVVTDPPYVGNVNYSELADFFYVWLRLALKARYPWFAPEYTEKSAEIVENKTRGKSRTDFFRGLEDVFRKICDALPDHGILVFTFHHTDQEGEVWEGLLQSLCDTGFEIAAVYPVHGEAESSLHLQDKENVSYDLIHVCRKRADDPRSRSWAGIRQEVRRRARSELAAIEAGRYGGDPLAEPDVRLICIGKCLELYSAHYNRVLDHENKPLPLHRALQDISTIVDQLVTRERPLPPELENIDSLSYVWLRCLMPRRTEIPVDTLSKDLRALQVSVEDVKNAGLVIRGRTGRGRTYEVKQPHERLEAALEALSRITARQAQTALFADTGQPEGLLMVDLWQGLIALANAGESVLDLLERFRPQWPEIAAGLRYSRHARSDWEQPIDRILAVMEGPALLLRQGAL